MPAYRQEKPFGLGNQCNCGPAQPLETGCFVRTLIPFVCYPESIVAAQRECVKAAVCPKHCPDVLFTIGTCREVVGTSGRGTCEVETMCAKKVKRGQIPAAPRPPEKKPKRPTTAGGEVIHIEEAGCPRPSGRARVCVTRCAEDSEGDADWETGAVDRAADQMASKEAERVAQERLARIVKYLKCKDPTCEIEWWPEQDPVGRANPESGCATACVSRRYSCYVGPPPGHPPWKGIDPPIWRAPTTERNGGTGLLYIGAEEPVPFDRPPPFAEDAHNEPSTAGPAHDEERVEWAPPWEIQQLARGIA
jgi:hypothetical protein